MAHNNNDLRAGLRVTCSFERNKDNIGTIVVRDPNSTNWLVRWDDDYNATANRIYQGERLSVFSSHWLHPYVIPKGKPSDSPPNYVNYRVKSMPERKDPTVHLFRVTCWTTKKVDDRYIADEILSNNELVKADGAGKAKLKVARNLPEKIDIDKVVWNIVPVNSTDT